MNLQNFVLSYKHSCYLQELGFKEPCIAAWVNESLLHDKIVRSGSGSPYVELDKFDDDVPAPTHVQALTYIQENYNLAIEIAWDSDISGWSYFVYDTATNHSVVRNWAYETWGAAFYDAIEALKTLIK